MELEQDAQAALSDAEKAIAAVKAAGVFTVLRTWGVKALTSIPSLIIGAGTLLMPSSLATKGVVALCTVGMIFGVYLKGRHDADIACSQAAAKEIAKNIKSYGKIKKHTAQMGKSQLDSSLNKWVH